MKIKNIFAGLITLLCLFSAGTVYCSDEWMMQIRVRSLDAQNKLIIGQRADATDRIEGRYDVPALPGGDIDAYLYLEGKQYWKDIKNTCNTRCRKTWNISVESSTRGEDVKLSWSLPDIPDNASIILIDKQTGVVTDMISKQYEYIYKNSGKKEFTVVAESWQ